MTMNTTPNPSTFEFLSTLDGKRYSLPPYDTAKFSDEVAAHPDFIPSVSLADALLADDPQEGLDSLEAPTKALNVLMKRSIVKTLRNHLAATDPAWLALKALIDAFEFDALAKVFTEWQKHYRAAEEESLGED